MNICLYGASSTMLSQTYLDAAYEMGAAMAKHAHTLVYGGGAQGVMGAAACGVRDGGGKIIGIAPSFFHVDGILFEDCTEFIYTETMRERKALMDERAEAFILAPGGIGSFEEIFEILTLKQIGRHNRPIAILNTQNYYAPMHQMLEHAVREKFVKAPCLQLYKLCDTPEEVLAYIENYDAEALDVRHLKNL
ncbi:MAG: TIGR00730 family Rossman fold protein [Oscillospiraceae bacterium]|nr:TIGR00730 family Rossman fold protein [Oscillospiraceae bacterium]